MPPLPRNSASKVVLFEKGEMGGDCLNYGCVPSKALLAAAKQAHAMRSGAALRHCRRGAAGRFRRGARPCAAGHCGDCPHDSQERFEKLGVTVVRAAARFRDARSLEAAGERFTARRIVIATGSRPAVPPIPGLADVPYLTNETLFGNATLPSHLLIIGAAPSAWKWRRRTAGSAPPSRCIEARLPLGQDDPELAAVVLERLAAEGVDILANRAVARRQPECRWHPPRVAGRRAR